MPLSRGVSDLAALELLVRVVDLGSVSRAAAVQGISQPSASAALHRLERRLGLALLDRSHTGSTPTPAGAGVAETARRLVDAARSLELEVEALQEQLERPLRVAASYSIAEYVLPGWLTSWQRSGGGRGVQLTMQNSADVQAEVLAGTADLGFVEGLTVDGRLHAHPVGGDELVLVVAPGHPWASRRGPIRAAELARTSMVTREPGSGTRAVVEARLAAHRQGRAPGPLLELGSTTAVKSAVMDGAGPALLSALAVRDEVLAARLRVVAVEGLDLSRTFWAVWRRSGRALPAAQALVRHVGRRTGASGAAARLERPTGPHARRRAATPAAAN